MWRHTIILCLLAYSAIGGCMTVPPHTMSAFKPSANGAAKPGDRDYNLNNPVEAQQMVDGIDLVLVRQTIAETPVGSSVSVVDSREQICTGTFIKTDRDQIELLNCVTKEAVPGPYGMRQCKTSHVPIQSFEIKGLKRFAAISAPPPGFQVPDIRKDSSGATVAEIVFQDGHKVGKPPDLEPANSQNAKQ